MYHIISRQLNDSSKFKLPEQYNYVYLPPQKKSESLIFHR